MEEALLTAIQKGNDDVIPLLVVAGARRLDCALYLAIQLERVKAIAILLLCKATITGDCQSISSLLSEPPDRDNVPWYMVEVHSVLMHGVVKMSYPIAVSIMEKNYDATRELLLRTDLDMRRKQVDWSKLKLTLLHPSWMYSIAPWVVNFKLVNNHLRKLPKELFSASQLRRLDLTHNLLETVPGDIFALPHLENLILRNNRLKELPDTPIWSQSLLSLDLSENDLQTLPQGMQYSSIEILNLSKNHFTSVPKCLCRIRALTSLDLSSMPITSLPKEMENLEHLVNLNVSNANISDLPGGGILRGAIKGIFKARARSNKPSNYVKLVILCHSDVAKALMYSKLKQNVLNPSLLHEIEVFQWSYRPLFTKAKLFSTQKLHFNTWLIGSSYDYCSIYPCFFTSSALYVVVWDMTRTGEMREQIKPYIDLLARYVTMANVLVICILPEPYETWAESNAEGLAKRLHTFFSKPVYHNLVYQGLLLFAVNPNTKEGQTDIKQRLYDVASTMTVNGQQVSSRHFPENYFTLIPVLEKEQNTFSTRGKPGVMEENAIWNLFDQALSSDPPDKMELPVIIDFLQDAGFLMHYSDPNDRLDHYYFMRPEWLYNTLLRVVRHTIQHANHLVVTYNELCSLANVDWSRDVSSALVRLMTRFAIVIPMKRSHYLIPCLLPHCSLPNSELHVGMLRRQFAPKTKALPADLWYRIICSVMSTLPRLTQITEVRRKVTSKELKTPKLDEDCEECLLNRPERGGETDEETDERASQLKKDSPPLLRRFLTEPSLSVSKPSKVKRQQSQDNRPSQDTSEETSLDHRSRSGAWLSSSTYSCSIEEKDVCPLLPPRAKFLRPEGRVATIEMQQVTIQHNKGERKQMVAESQNTELQNTHDSSPEKTSPQPPITSSSSKPTSEPDGPHTTRLPHPVNSTLVQSTELLDDHASHLEEAARSSSLPEGSARPRGRRVTHTPPQHRKRRGSHSEPVCIERGMLVWNTGVLYKYKDIHFSIYPCTCEVSTVEERGIEICTTRNDIGRIVLAHLCRLVQKLLEQRYPNLFSMDVQLHKHELTQLAICPICLERRERNPTSFLVEACVHALREKDEHNCRYHPECVPLRDLIPDYIMVDFPAAFQLVPSSFHYSESKPLHRSLSTTLFHGNFQGQDVAVKVQLSTDGKSITLPLSIVRQEMEMLVHLDHPNIVRTFGCCLQPSCVLLEKAPLGNLYQKLMDTEQKISRTIRFHISCQVASALEYLHGKDIIYRTLKASSILVWSLDFTDEVNVKLANFERAEFQSPSGLLSKTDFASYPAPEMLRYSFTEEYSEKIDIYSFGILLYELVTRWQPFGGIYNSNGLPVAQRPKLSGVVTTGYSTLVKLMDQCWQEDLTQRPSATALIKKLSNPAFQCHIATQVLRDCISVRGSCFVPSVRQIWVYGEYSKMTQCGEGSCEVEGTQIFILNAENLSVQGSLELKERASSIFTIDNKVWVGMTEACVHAYDTTTFRFTDRFYLKDSVTVIEDNDTYAFIGQANGQLMYYPKLIFPKETRMIDIGKKAIISMVSIDDDIWLSCGNEIVILNADEEVTIEKRWVACDPSDQIYALVLSKDGTTVWSLVRGSYSITSWNVSTGEQKDVAHLDKDLQWICCELNYDPSFLRLISLECVNDTLWLGLSCGVIVILTAQDKPEIIVHFRAHRSATKCLMAVPTSDAGRQEHPIILSGGYGEVSSLSSTMTEQNGVILSWQALSAQEFSLVANRSNRHLGKLT